MTISKDLFLAILSMDAYNRGYGAGLADTPSGATNGLGVTSGGNIVRIGNAEIKYDSAVLVDGNEERLDQPAGFYAIAYDITGPGYQDDDPTGDHLTAGDTVISYRGTDNPDVSGFADSGSDFRDGWIFGSDVLGRQTVPASY